MCNKPTNGVFNTAHEIIKKQKEVAAVKEDSTALASRMPEAITEDPD